jgi:hypothetical protein
MIKIAMYIAIIGAAYWYWSGPYQDGREMTEADILKNNAMIMKRCIKQENSMQGAGGLGGVAGGGSVGADAETICAQNNKLQLRDGNWQTDDGY